MDLQNLRAQIDETDDRILLLFKRRMDISRQIALFKKENGLSLLDSVREKDKLADIGDKAGAELRSYAHTLYNLLFELSRAHQGSILNPESNLSGIISDASKNTEKVFPKYTNTACECVEGAYSQIDCDLLMCELEGMCEEFHYLGSYTVIV